MYDRSDIHSGIFLSYQGYIDGYDELHIKGNNLWYVHRDYGLPGSTESDRNQVARPTLINGKAWFPQFNNDISDLFTLEDSTPNKKMHYVVYARSIIAANETYLEGTENSSINILQQPNQENDFELVIGLDDFAHPGESLFKFMIVSKIKS
jgi:hypothetical protein